ncbi:MAG TPA: acyltransferase [Variovorax sp.]|nr:acyltransferase [Variovorax sp.]
MNVVSEEKRRVFHALDAARGLAALVVVLYHIPGSFRGTHFGSGYLAVDFFFGLSGFVLAHAYLERLGTGRMTLREFAVARLIRLYPLYALSLAVLLAILAVMAATGLPLPWSPIALAGKLPFAVAMLPSPTLDVEAYLYAFNIPAWSILFELAVNLLFALVARPLRHARTRWGLIAVSGAILALQIRTQHDLGGDTWHTLAAGVPRVCFSFFVGVQIHEWLRHRHAGTSLHPLWSVPALGVLLACLCGPDRHWLVLASIFLVFPALIATLALGDVPGGIAGRALRRLGVLSYAVYMLHGPMLMIWATWFAAPGWPAATRVAGLAVLLAAVVAASWLADVWVDAPVRARLGRWARARAGRRTAPVRASA